MAGMDHGDTGVMSDSDMTGLADAGGTEAATLYLTGMTTHHAEAIAMAENEVKRGKNTDAVALARKIITSQTAEIQMMKDLLASF